MLELVDVATAIKNLRGRLPFSKDDEHTDIVNLVASYEHLYESGIREFLQYHPDAGMPKLH